MVLRFCVYWASRRKEIGSLDARDSRAFQVSPQRTDLSLRIGKMIAVHNRHTGLSLLDLSKDPIHGPNEKEMVVGYNGSRDNRDVGTSSFRVFRALSWFTLLSSTL